MAPHRTTRPAIISARSRQPLAPRSSAAMSPVQAERRRKAPRRAGADSDKEMRCGLDAPSCSARLERSPCISLCLPEHELAGYESKGVAREMPLVLALLA